MCLQVKHVNTDVAMLSIEYHDLYPTQGKARHTHMQMVEGAR